MDCPSAAETDPTKGIRRMPQRHEIPEIGRDRPNQKVEPGRGRGEHHLDADGKQLAFVSGWLDANFCAQIQLPKPKLPHSRLLGDGSCRQDAGGRLQQRHDLDGTFCEACLLLGPRQQLSKAADLLGGVGLGQADPCYGWSPSSWVASQSATVRRASAFAEGATASSRSAMIASAPDAKACCSLRAWSPGTYRYLRAATVSALPVGASRRRSPPRAMSAGAHAPPVSVGRGRASCSRSSCTTGRTRWRGSKPAKNSWTRAMMGPVRNPAGIAVTPLLSWQAWSRSPFLA